IDRVTIGSTTSAIGMGYPYQRRVFVTGNGVIFALVYDGSNLDYIVSTDGGVTWNTILIAACASCQAQDFAWWWDGSFVYLVDGPNNSANSICSSLPTGYFCYKVGTVSGSTITWDSLQNVASGANQVSSALIPSIITDSTGHI